MAEEDEETEDEADDAVALAPLTNRLLPPAPHWTTAIPQRPMDEIIPLGARTVLSIPAPTRFRHWGLLDTHHAMSCVFHKVHHVWSTRNLQNHGADCAEQEQFHRERLIP